MTRISPWHVALSLLLLPAPAVAQEKQETSYPQLVSQGQVHWRAGRQAQALEAFRRALVVEPRGSEAHRGIGRVYRAQKNWRLAVQHLKQAVELAPQDGLSHFWLGVTYEQDAAYHPLAIAHLKKAIGLLPPTATVGKFNLRADANNRIGGMEMKRGGHAAARAAFLRAHRISKQNPLPLHNLARMAHNAGRFDEARGWYEKLLALRPGDAKLKATLERIRKKQSVYRIELRLLVSSLTTGERLGLDQLAFRGYDKQGRIVDFEQHWEVSSGLVLEQTDPLAIRAKDSPSREEYIYLTDKKTGVFGKALLRVSGKPLRLALAPEHVTAFPGQEPVLRVETVDAAGNRLAPPMVTWEIKLGEEIRPWTVQQLTERSFRVSIPKQAAAGKHRITARCAGLSVVGQLEVTQAGAGTSSLVDWQDDLEAAQAAARKAGKLLLLYVWTLDSPPCDRLDAETWSEPRVRTELARMVVVKLNADNHPQTVERFRIQQLPALVLFSPQGIYVSRQHGFVGPARLRLLLNREAAEAQAIEARLAKLQAAKAAQPTEVGPLLELAKFHAGRYDNARASQAYRAALALGPAEPIASRCRLSLAYFHIRSREFAEAEQHVDAALASALHPLDQAQAQYYKGLCLFYGQAPEQARAVWTRLREKYPQTNWGELARKMLEKKFGAKK